MPFLLLAQSRVQFLIYSPSSVASVWVLFSLYTFQILCPSFTWFYCLWHVMFRYGLPQYSTSSSSLAPPGSANSNESMESLDDALKHKTLTPQRKHHKLLKDGSEVWSQEVEKIFVEGNHLRELVVRLRLTSSGWHRIAQILAVTLGDVLPWTQSMAESVPSGPSQASWHRAVEETSR